tara:strand:+ start:693 stop:1145 length:453 start_codon:yes stop_codon:yes gene_type:complete
MIKKLIKEFWQISGEFDSSDIKKSFVNNLNEDNDEVFSFMSDILEEEINKTTNEKLLIKMEHLQYKINKYDRFPYEDDMVMLLGKITNLGREISSAGSWLNDVAHLPADLKGKVDSAFRELYKVFEEIAEDIVANLEEQQQVDREGYMHG